MASSHGDESEIKTRNDPASENFEVGFGLIRQNMVKFDDPISDTDSNSTDYGIRHAKTIIAKKPTKTSISNSDIEDDNDLIEQDSF